MRMATLQEFMIAMECFFFEWYPDKDDEGPFGRVHVSNNTQAVEKSMKEGGVSSAFLPIILQMHQTHPSCATLARHDTPSKAAL